MKYQLMNKRMEKRQEEALEMVFDRLDKTLDNINRQTNLRTENEQLFTNRNIDNIANEITATVTNHTNKLIDDLEMKYQQMNKRLEKRQEEALEMVFHRLDKTLDNINRQTNLRTENEQLFNNRNIDNTMNENIQINNRQYNRQQENRNRRTNSITTEERETAVVEPPLPFYKQLTSMSINEEPQIEQSISSGSVPTTIRPFDGTDPAYTVEEYLNSIVAAMIFSSGIEPVNKPGHHQWKKKEQL